MFPALTGEKRAAACPFHSSLPDGVMAAQATLTRLVMVRIHVGQPFDAPSEHGLLMACGRQIKGSESVASRSASNGPEQAKRAERTEVEWTHELAPL